MDGLRMIDCAASAPVGLGADRSASARASDPLGIASDVDQPTEDDYMAFFEAFVPPLPATATTATGAKLRRVGDAERALMLESLDLYIAAASRGQTLVFLQALKDAVQTDAYDACRLMELAICAATAESSEERGRLEWFVLRSSDVRLAIATVFTASDVEGLLRVLLGHQRTAPIMRRKAALRSLAMTWGRGLVYRVGVQLTTSGVRLLHSATDSNLVGVEKS
jgi:hypothetical protein